jgi:hypothetical protein
MEKMRFCWSMYSRLRIFVAVTTNSKLKKLRAKLPLVTALLLKTELPIWEGERAEILYKYFNGHY